MVDDSERDEVRTIISSLLVSQKNAITISLLDREYYKEEGTHIPWRKFGYAHLLEFLESMPQYFKIEQKHGSHYIRGIPSEKSGHVSSLVARQKTPKNNTPYKHYKPSYYTPYMQRPKNRISAEDLNALVMYINDNPNGISIQMALLMIQKKVPHITISMNDLLEQLYELSHQLYINGEVIRPLRTNGNHDFRKTNFQSPLVSGSHNTQSPQVIYDVAGNESDEPTNLSNYSKSFNELLPNFIPNLTANHNELLNCNNDDDGYGAVGGDEASVKTDDLSQLINKRMKSRLEQLIQKEPHGIWCAELPDKYLKEYKVPLNYTDLGFNSVREFVSYLPDICYTVQKYPNGDFKLYSTNRNTNELKSRRTDEANEQYDSYDDKNLPVPLVLPSSLCKKFVPADVIDYDESVDPIFVNDLIDHEKKYIEVYVVEIFTPSFFWIQFRQNKKRFDAFMRDLHTFYAEKSNFYSIPQIALKKGLNCACKYNDIWHRAIIKTVKPDKKVTVLFYDYGTLKTYSSEEVYFLHKDFAYLPAQAIPCGLYNVSPPDGNKWKKSTCDRFVERISGIPLMASIVSVDISNNSMLIILADTTGETDVHINDWMENQNLAIYKEMVCIEVRMLTHTNFFFLHYKNCKDIAKSSTLVKKHKTENIANIDKVKYDENRSISCDTKVHGLSEENKMVEKNMQEIQSSPDADLSKNISVKKRSKGPRELVMLLEKLKELAVKTSTENISCSEIDRDFKNNAEQSSSSVEINVKQEVNDSNSERDSIREYSNMEFSPKDSDDEESNQKNYFGTFRSLLGGNGSMKPFDWSKIKETDSPDPTATDMSHKNLNRDKKRASNEIKDKLELQNQENKPAPRKCFLNAVYNSIKNNEDEYWLPRGNIDYEDRNMSQSVAKLRTRMEMDNDKCTMVTIKKKRLEALCEGRQSRYISKSNTNNITVTESDGTDFSKDLVPKKAFNKDNKNTNSITEIYVNQKIDRNVASNNEYKLVSSSTNDTEQDKLKYTSECNVDNSESIMYKKCIQDRNQNFTNTKESFINEPIQSFPGKSAPDGPNDIMPSLDNQQNVMTTCLNSLHNFTKPTFTLESLNSHKSDNSSESQTNISQENSIIPSSASERPAIKRFGIHIQVPKVLEQLSKIQNMTKNVELHSSDSSSSESNHENKTSSGDSNCTSVICNSDDANKSEEPIPVVNDLNIDSDESEFDCYVGPEDLSAFMTQYGPKIKKMLEDKSKKL